MIRVITYGTYDLLHYGHIKLLERAKALGDYLIVGITSDDYDKTRGKINNQQTLMERIAAVEATGLADEIVVEEYEGQKIDDIRRLNIDIFTVGSDWKGHFDYLNEYCKVVYLPRTEGISSSEIRAEKRKIKFSIIGDLSVKKKFAKELQYVNGAELVKSVKDADAVYVASLPQKHYEDVKNMLLTGKHVICESPISIKTDQCRELIKIAKNKNLILADAIKTAYATAYSRLLGVAKSGRIGDIVSIDVTCTSLSDGADETNADLSSKQNSICAWGPTALLPVFQLLGTKYRNVNIYSKIIDDKLMFDGFTKIDFLYDHSVATVKVAKTAKSEGELIISGTKGYIYVPAPWWKTDYFEVRYENQTDNKRYFYQLDGEGIRYELVVFLKSMSSKKDNAYITTEVSNTICEIIEKFYNRDIIEIK